jgi:ketosteroid isomerase-like protein
MSDVHPHERVARQLIEGVTRGDVESVDRLYADDIRVWRNVDQRELVKKQALKVVGILSGLKDIEYRDLRIVPTEQGYVQQHVLSCTGPKGEEVRMPACIVVRVEDDQIARIDEYADSAAMAPLMG